MLKLNYFSGETFDCIAFSSFKDIFFVTEVFKVVLLIEIPTLSTVALTSLLLGETVTYSYDEAQTGKLNYNDCKNQPKNFCTRNRRHFHAEWPAHFKKGCNYEVHPTHRYSFSSQIVLSFPSLKMMPISSNVFLILSAKSQFFSALAFARISITLSINA